MRLIVAETLELVEYVNIPPKYAILSHTWDDEEVTYQDMLSSSTDKSHKRGWTKIEKACLVAIEYGFELIWIDTCCIDKTNSVELSEAINSMFKWYMGAELCIAHLSDLRPGKESVEHTLTTCRWWQRGWTLQELIAPRYLDFYNSAWDEVGSKQKWQSLITKHTGIPPEVLSGHQPPHHISVSQIFSWAADRRTTRVEDTSYCLLGLFDVNMPLLYGEGSKAFQRLQEEIIKHNNDLTVFAHNSDSTNGSLFAKSPADFRLSATIVASKADVADFSFTNRGLRMSGDIPLRRGRALSGESLLEVYFMKLGYDSQNEVDGGICLSKIGPRLYHKSAAVTLAGFGHYNIWLRGKPISHSTDFYILPNIAAASIQMRRKITGDAICLGQTHESFARVKELVPHVLFDYGRRLCLLGTPKSFGTTDTVIAIQYSVRISPIIPEVELIILCDRRQRPSTTLVFKPKQHPQAAALLFAEVHRENSIPWVVLEMQYPRLDEMGCTTEVDLEEDGLYRIRASLKEFEGDGVDTSVFMHALEVSVTKDEKRT